MNSKNTLRKIREEIPVPNGYVIVPDNDWAFMAGLMRFSPAERGRFYTTVGYLFPSAKELKSNK
ncbi:MAG: hypothetical protein KGZ69_12000 [Methylomonas sp.]|nr:hypothetical protein [Methylomonas sp.]